MNRRQLLRSAALLPTATAALSAASAQQKQIKITGIETDVLKRFETSAGSSLLRCNSYFWNRQRLGGIACPDRCGDYRVGQ
jgi:hypothetical protein